MYKKSQICQNQKRFLKIKKCKKVNKSTHCVYSDGGPHPAQMWSATLEVTPSLSLSYHYLIITLPLSYHYLIMIITRYQPSHHSCHDLPQQLGLVGCVRDLVVEGSSVGLAEVSHSL